MNKKIKIGHYETTGKQLLFLAIHVLIIIAFTVQILYCIITFSTIAKSGTAVIDAGTIPYEEMITRRLYAIELWISASGLAVYLGVVNRKHLTHFFDKTTESIEKLTAEE